MSTGLVLGPDGLYSEVQGIMGIGYIGPPMDRQTHNLKLYLSATPLAIGEYVVVD